MNIMSWIIALGCCLNCFLESAGYATKDRVEPKTSARAHVFLQEPKEPKGPRRNERMDQQNKERYVQWVRYRIREMEVEIRDAEMDLILLKTKIEESDKRIEKLMEDIMRQLPTRRLGGLMPR